MYGVIPFRGPVVDGDQASDVQGPSPGPMYSDGQGGPSTNSTGQLSTSTPQVQPSFDSTSAANQHGELAPSVNINHHRLGAVLGQPW